MLYCCQSVLLVPSWTGHVFNNALALKGSGGGRGVAGPPLMMGEMTGAHSHAQTIKKMFYVLPFMTKYLLLIHKCQSPYLLPLYKSMIMYVINDTEKPDIFVSSAHS